MKYKDMAHKDQANLDAFYVKKPEASECILKKNEKIIAKTKQEIKEAMKTQQKTAQEMVEEMLEHDEKARNNDLWLILQIWQRSQDIKVFVPFNKLDEMISPETITRCRRKIQNTDKKWLPTKKEVAEKRGIKEEAMREYYGGNNNE